MVAERAGTSVSTVSLVANGKDAGRVSRANAERVRQAIKELGYVGDHVARALSRGTSDIVVLVTPDTSSPFFAGVIAGIRAELGQDYQLLLSVTDLGDVPTAGDLSLLAGLRPAGLIVDAPSESFLRDLKLNSAIVLIDAPRLTGSPPAVNFDLEGGIRALMDHLAQLGHRRVGYLGSSTGTMTFHLRDQLLQAAGRRLGVVVDGGAASTSDIDHAAEAFTAVWPTWQAAGVTAVVGATDTHAYGVLKAAATLGLRVPEDIAVAGFDDLAYSTISNPPLTSVALSGTALGRTGARMLLRQIRGEATEPTVELDTALVVRASTAGSQGAARSAGGPEPATARSH